MAELHSDEGDDILISSLRREFPDSDISELLRLLCPQEENSGKTDTSKPSGAEEALLDLWEQATRRIQESELSEKDKKRLRGSRIARRLASFALILPKDDNYRSYQDTSAIPELEAQRTIIKPKGKPRGEYNILDKVSFPRHCMEALAEIDPDVVPKDALSRHDYDVGSSSVPTDTSSARGHYTCNLCGYAPKKGHRCPFVEVQREFLKKVVKKYPENPAVMPDDWKALLEGNSDFWNEAWENERVEAAKAVARSERGRQIRREI